MANIAAIRMHPFHPKQLSDIEMQVVTCDLLIIGGGNAGCFVATEAAKLAPSLKVVIMEKAEIMRSGACSAGMDAINTYIPKGKTPEDLSGGAARRWAAGRSARISPFPMPRS